MVRYNIERKRESVRNREIITQFVGKMKHNLSVFVLLVSFQINAEKGQGGLNEKPDDWGSVANRSAESDLMDTRWNKVC